MYVTDQCGREVYLPSFPPKRIVSLVPSQTELVFDLGADDSLVGRTRFCIHPKNRVKQIVKIGGTKDLNLGRIYDLKPDLIIGNKEENEKFQIEQLQSQLPVWLSDIRSQDAELDMIMELGRILNKTSQAKTISDIKKKFWAEMSVQFKHFYGSRVLYLIWNNPIMSVGADTYIHFMLNTCGLVNVLQDFQRYPILDEKKLMELTPDFLFLSSEPYPFKEKHIHLFQALLPNTKILLVDGEFFSWYGSRQLHVRDYPQYLLGQLM
jgi:ABC-type Fe3+-hydroxamate transport system substrate-binding protein